MPAKGSMAYSGPIIDKTLKARSKSLNLTGCGLLEWPKEIFTMDWLEQLAFSQYVWDPEKNEAAYHSNRKYYSEFDWLTAEEEAENLDRPNKLPSIPRDILCLKNLRSFHADNSFATPVGSRELEWLSRLPLKSLDLSFCGLLDTEVLKKFTQLEALWLNGNQLADISFLRFMPCLKNLKLCQNQINDLNPLSGLHQLNSLDLACNSINDLKPIGELTNLRSLNLYSNQISDIAPLKNLQQLKELSLGSNPLENPGPLSELTGLETLKLCELSIADISFIRKNVNLVELNLEDNQISDLSPLSDLQKLEKLDLTNNRISEVAPAAMLKQLHYLYLKNNPISDKNQILILVRNHKAVYFKYAHKIPREFTGFAYLDGTTLAEELDHWSIDSFERVEAEFGPDWMSG